MRSTTITSLLISILMLAGCGGNSSSSSSATTAPATTATKPPEVLNGIRVQPSDVVLDQQIGAAFQIIVDGHYADGLGRPVLVDLTRDVTFTVSDPRVARISGTGLVTPLATGNTTIVAEITNVDGSFSASTNVQVVKPSGARRPTFTAVQILPKQRTLWKVNPHAGKDDFQQMIVLGTDQQGRKHDLTRAVGVQLQDTSGKPTVVASVNPMGLLRGRSFGEVVAVGRIDSAGLIDGASVVCGRSWAKPHDPNAIYNGAPLAGSQNPIDVAVLEGLRDRAIEPAPLADDGEFLRRLYADAIGRSPTEAQLLAFRRSTNPNKRAVEVNRLLNSPAFADHWASVVGEWLIMPRRVRLAGTQRGNWDFTSPHTITITVDGGAPQNLRLEASMFNDATNVNAGQVVRELNRIGINGARAIRFDNNVHLETDGDGPGTSLAVAATDLGNMLGLGGQSRGVIDTWSRAELAQGTSLGDMFASLARGNVAAFEARHQTAADKVDVFLLAGTGQTARCAKCHDHPLPGPNDPIRWLQDERYPLDAFFAANAAEATKLDGKTNLRFDPPKDPGFVLDPSVTITTKLADPLADRRDEFARVFTGSEAFMQGLGHRIFAQVMSPLLDPNQFLQANLDGIMVPAVFDAIGDTFRAENTSLQGFLRVVFTSRAYQLTSATDGLDMANDAFLQRRTLRMRYAEVFDHSLAETTGRAGTDGDVAFIHETFGYPARRQTVTERVSAVNMSQAFLLLNSPSVQDRIEATNALPALLSRLIGLNRMTKEQAVQKLFRTALSRDPDPAERAMYLDTINQAPTVREGLEDCAAATVALVEFGLH